MARASSDIRDLGTSPADRDLLRAFYTDLFIPAFADADERESLVNIQRYLELKAAGWYGANNYHIRVLLDGGRLVGGTIADYLAGPNTGVIEFLVVVPLNVVLVFHGHGLKALITVVVVGRSAAIRVRVLFLL